MIATSLVVTAFLVATSSAQNINQLFTVDPSCDPNTIQGVLTDARTLLNNAQSAVQTLVTSSFIMRGRNRLLAKNAENSFGITDETMTNLRGLSQDDKTTMNTVGSRLGNIQSLLSGQQVGAVSLSPQNAYIACSDSSYVYTQDAHDIDPSLPPNTPASSQYGAPNGLFYVPNGPTDGEGRKTAVLRARMPNQQRICVQVGEGQTIQAQIAQPGDYRTHTALTQMILCPVLFDGSKDVNNVAWLTTINPNPGPPDRGYDIPKTNWKFTAGAFIHEMFHILSVDTYRDRPFTLNGGPPFTTYGPQNVRLVATNNRGKNGGGVAPYMNMGTLTTLDQPDAYRMFCEYCNFPDVDWSFAGDGG